MNTIKLLGILLLFSISKSAIITDDWGTYPGKSAGAIGSALSLSGNYPVDMDFHEIPITLFANSHGDTITTQDICDQMNMQWHVENGIKVRWIPDDTRTSKYVIPDSEWPPNQPTTVTNLIRSKYIYSGARSPNSLSIFVLNRIGGAASVEEGWCTISELMFLKVNTALGERQYGNLCHEMSHLIAAIDNTNRFITDMADTNQYIYMKDETNWNDIADFFIDNGDAPSTLSIDNNLAKLSTKCFNNGLGHMNPLFVSYDEIDFGGDDCYYLPGGVSDKYPPIIDKYLEEHPAKTIDDIHWNLSGIDTYSLGGYPWKLSEAIIAWVDYNLTNNIEASPHRLKWNRDSIQQYTPVEYTVVGASPKNVVFNRVTLDKRNRIGFPDYYIVHSKKSAKAKWVMRGTVTAESSVGVFPTELTYAASTSDSYWLITPVDSQVGFTYEATGANADWATYIGDTYGKADHSIGWTFREGR